jgi:hypothetical protein
VLRVFLAVAGVTAMLASASVVAQAGRHELTNENFFLSMAVKGCPCKGKLLGMFTSSGTVAEQGPVKGRFKAQPTLAKPTLSGSTTLTGAHGTIVIAYSGRLIPTSPPHSDGSVDYEIGVGTWSVRTASGGFAPLRGGGGKFYATVAKNLVHASYLPA